MALSSYANPHDGTITVRPTASEPDRYNPYPGLSVREPTIPERIQETQGYLNEAHAILERLAGGGNVGNAAPAEWTFVQGTADLSASAASLVGRLRTLFGDPR